MEKKDIDRMTEELLKNSLQKPASNSYDDVLMEKIMGLPEHNPYAAINRLLKNGWKFLLLALGLFICTLSIIAYMGSWITPDLEKYLIVIKNYILYGGMVLFVPLLFGQIDELLGLIFKSQLRANPR